MCSSMCPTLLPELRPGLELLVGTLVMIKPWVCETRATAKSRRASRDAYGFIWPPYLTVHLVITPNKEIELAAVVCNAYINQTRLLTIPVIENAFRKGEAGPWSVILPFGLGVSIVGSKEGVRIFWRDPNALQIRRR